MAADLVLLDQITKERFPQDPIAQQRAFWQTVADLAPHDIMAYGLYVHGREAPVYRKAASAQHLRIIGEAFETKQKNLIITPPECFKSTLSRWRVEMWLGIETERHFADPEHPAPCSIYAMNTAKQAERMAKAIASTIESNSRYQELYPNVKPDKGWGWSSEQFYLQRLVPRPDPSLFPVGISGPIQGMRAGLGVIDDPTNQHEARSPARLQQQIEWRLGMYSDRLTEDAIEIDIFTRWSKSDMYSALSQDDTRNVIVMPAVGFWSAHPEYGIQTPQDVLWPEVWPWDRLEKKRREKMLTGDGGLWQLTYLCNPEIAEGNWFKRMWLTYGLPLDGPVTRENVA